MSIIRTEHLHEFVARLDTSLPAPAPIVGMHAINLERFSEDGTTISERLLPAVPVDFAGLAGLMSNENLQACIDAFTAELESRA